MKNEKIKTLNKPAKDFNLRILDELYKKLDFEFMDLETLPNSLRATLRDLLEVGCNLRGYYQWVASAIYEYANKNNISEIVELGAGCAPITRILIKNYPNWAVKFKITDINPDMINFKKLENSDPRVSASYEPHDFTKKMDGFKNSLLVLSATFHHVREGQRKDILFNLKKISQHVIIFEPVKPDQSSKLVATCGFFSGLITPFFRIRTKNFYRCFFWCWVIPIAPIMFAWDGFISSFRCWSKQKWRKQEPNAIIEETFYNTKIILT